MLVPCHLPPQLIQKLRRTPIHDVEVDGAQWEAFSNEYQFAYWRVTAADGSVIWYQIR